GRRISSTNDYGVEEFVGNPDYPALKETLFMPDGGKVKSNQTYFYQGYEYPTNFTYPVQIIDPYGQITTLSWVIYGWDRTYTHPSIKLDRVTEPGGRYLQINWDATSTYINSVQAFDGVNSQPIQTVTYTWSNFTLG